MIYYNDLENAPCMLIKGYANTRKSKYYLGGFNNTGNNIVDVTFKAKSTLEIETFYNFYLDLNDGNHEFEIDVPLFGSITKCVGRFLNDLKATYTSSIVAEFKMQIEIMQQTAIVNLIYDGTLTTNLSTGVRSMADIGVSPKNNGVVYSGRHIFIDHLTMYVDYPVDVNTQSIIIYDVDARQHELITSFTTATYHRLYKSHSHVLILDTLATAEDVKRLDAFAEDAVSLWYTGVNNTLTFAKLNIQHLFIGCEVDGANVYDITDADDTTFATIFGYTEACRKTYENVYFGGQTVKYLTGVNGVVFEMSDGMEFYNGAFIRIPTKPITAWFTSGCYSRFEVNDNTLIATECTGGTDVYIIGDDGSIAIADNGSYATSD